MPHTSLDVALSAMSDIVTINNEAQSYIITRADQKRERRMGFAYAYQKAIALSLELRCVGLIAPKIDFSEFGLESVYRKMRVIVLECETMAHWSGHEFTSLLEGDLIQYEGERVRIRIRGMTTPRTGYLKRLGHVIKYHGLTYKPDHNGGYPLTFKKFDELEIL